MSILPEETRENDQETLNREEIHKMNKENEHEAHQHENPNPNLNREHNPQQHDAGGR